MNSHSIYEEINIFRAYKNYVPDIIVGKETFKRIIAENLLSYCAETEASLPMLYGCILEVSSFFDYGFILR
jgi:hypothetical protein